MAFLNWKIGLKFCAAVGLLYAASQISHAIAQAIEFELRPSNEDAVHRIITLSAFSYTGLLALPFVPGAEIGLALLVALGPPIAFLVYICTVVGLCISFLLGRFVPSRVLIALAETANLVRLAHLLEQFEPLSQKERIAFLTGGDDKFMQVFMRLRYVGLALLFNVPGNFLIGGGGGIGMIAGLSGLYSFSGYLVTVIIAVSPVPLLVCIFGVGFLS